MHENGAAKYSKCREIFYIDIAANFMVVLNVEPYEVRVAAFNGNALEYFAEFATDVTPRGAQRDYDQRTVRVPA